MKKRILTGFLVLLLLVVSGCSQAGDYYKEGKRYFEDGSYEQAAESFSRAIKENPNRAEYYIDYGMTLIKLGDYEEAISQLDNAYTDKDILIVKQNNKRIHRGKGIAYCHIKDYEKAVEEFKKALEINELSYMDVDILNYMGTSLTITGAYQEAIKIYSMLLSKDNSDSAAYVGRALCYRYMGDYEKSLADYDQAISLKPAEYTAYFGKYYLMEGKGNKTEAAEVLAKAAEIEATTSEDKFNLAKIHYYQGEYETALSELNEGLANGYTEAYYYMGEIYRIQKDYQKAIYYYENFINEGKSLMPNVYNQIASCLIKTEDYKNAIKYLESGIAYNDAGTIRTLKKNEIIAYECLGDFTTAFKKMEEYLSEYPRDEEALRELEFIKTRVIDISREDEQAPQE